MKLKSFGCSFTYGSDLSDCGPVTQGYPGYLISPSKSTWPALLAQSLNAKYECHAKPGIGNLQIYNSILAQIESTDSDFFVINWTWTDRFDFMDPLTEQWATLRPGSDNKEHKLHYKYFYNQYHSMITNASYINSAIQLLEKHNIKFIMTAVDSVLFDTVDPGWQDPRAITLLQNEIKPHITDFDGQTFLEWAKSNDHKISPAWHPLESAHRAAFELIKSYNLV